MKSAVQAKVVSFLLRLFEHGLPQDETVLHYMSSTHGGTRASDFRAMLADRDTPDASSLAELLLFPDDTALNRLEQVLEGADCSPEEAAAVAETVGRICTATRAVLPGGEEVPLPLESGDAARFVERLRLQHSAPRELSKAVDARFPGESGASLKVALRHCRLEWTAGRVLFLAALIGNMASSGEERAVLLWALEYLGALPQDAAPSDSLGMKYAGLTTRLRRSLDFQAALAKSSFEVLMAQGARVVLPHPDQIRGELALLDAVCLAVTGRPAWSLAGMTETDLGEVEDGEAAMEILRRFGD